MIKKGKGHVDYIGYDGRFKADWHKLLPAIIVTAIVVFCAYKINQDIQYTAPTYEITQEIPCE